MINFSVLGRNCAYTDRDDYHAWDSVTRERQFIIQELTRLYPQYDFTAGGNISIDITPKNRGKEQIVKKIRKIYPFQEIIFFGDKIEESGNDYYLAKELEKSGNAKVIGVENYFD